ncbi:MAG: Ig-like domain-containing protein, partial [Acidobacteriota bacterium]|nr:Ig-like domain-containing protein [Acidobacteriota bacterium]
MHKSFPRPATASFRKPVAMLVAYLTLVTPLAPVFAQAAKVKRGQSPAPAAPVVTQAPSKTGGAAGSVKRLTLPAPHITSGTPNIVATKTDNLPQSTQIAPSGQITYTVTITNNGTGDATGVSFSDTVDPNTSVDANSAVMAVGDDYTAIGNVNFSVGAPGLLANDLDIDAGNNTGMTTSAETKSSANCVGCNNVVISGDGSFTYEPPVGFNGTDSFTYTAHTSGGKTATVTARVVVSNRIWFVNDNAGACTSNCDGRLSHPFTDLASFQAVNGDGAVGHPQNGDAVFLYQSATPYVGPVTLRNGQLLIGQDTTAPDLLTAAGFTAPSGTITLPSPDTGGASVTITTTAPSTNAINLGSGNTLRGFTVDATTGTKISGSGFGTLVVGNSASPDVTLSGAGQALSLTNGTLSVAGAFKSVATTSSTGAGVSLSQVADSDGAGGGSFAFNGVNVSGSITAEGIKVTGSTADLNFGATSVTGGKDGVSLSNNSAGTRTFSTLTVTGVSGIGFFHFDPDGGGAQVGGGATTVSGTTTITNPTGKGISIDRSNADITFAATTVNKNASASHGVDLSNNATRTISFTSLDSTTTTGFALNTNASGTVNVSGGNLTQSGAGGAAASLANTTLG